MWYVSDIMPAVKILIDRSYCRHYIPHITQSVTGGWHAAAPAQTPDPSAGGHAQHTPQGSVRGDLSARLPGRESGQHSEGDGRHKRGPLPSLPGQGGARLRCSERGSEGPTPREMARTARPANGRSAVGAAGGFSTSRRQPHGA